MWFKNIWDSIKTNLKRRKGDAAVVCCLLLIALVSVAFAVSSRSGARQGEADRSAQTEREGEWSGRPESGDDGHEPGGSTVPAGGEDGSGDRAASVSDKGERETRPTDSGRTASGEGEAPTPEPVCVSSATLGATGDILLHMAVLEAFSVGEGFDFSPAFTEVAPYYQSVDLMAANLEVPLVDPADGYAYSGNPFASPDAIAAALKNAGVDICLTANNHTYDAGHYGLIRTQQVLEGLGLGRVGTRKSEDESFLTVRDVNGIRIGMACWTYETGADEWCEKTLNGIGIPEADARLINSFCFERLEEFYGDAEETLRLMAGQGCEATVFFIHWGDEYEDLPNALQQEIAHRLSALGVDVIIGGHPHVVQKYEVIENADGHRTAVLYSLGNELSNQRKEYMSGDGFRGYTEDGVIFIVRFDKYDNGEVRLGDTFAIPTWVEQAGIFRIVPLDPAKSPEEWPAYNKALAMESYQRTTSRLWG